jgi:3-deoxy-D-manno-octulosonic-acid transferase
LNAVYSVADVVIIGGGFGNHGGQNLVQPLALGKPVIHGPHMQNFKSVAEEAQRTGASIVCSNSAELSSALQSLISDQQKRDEMGKAASALVKRHVGAARRYAEAIAEAAKSQR